MAGKLTLKEGIKDGSPIFVGYFTTALAFGLLTRTSGLRFVEGILISLTNYSGSGQFLMMNLYNSGALLLEICISVLFINTRYLFMASSLVGRLEDPNSIPLKLVSGFGTTDEVFAVASFKGSKLNMQYMCGLVFISYIGWVLGTAVGYVAGTFLPEVIQKASVITVYAMFASLLGGETRKLTKTIFVFMLSAALNSLFIIGFSMSVGISFIISMIAATLFGARIYTDEEVGIA